MMTIREYSEAVAERIENAQVVEIEKANGIKYVGVSVRDGNVGMNIYLEQMLSEGLTIEQAVAKVNEIYLQHKANMAHMGDIAEMMKDYDLIKDKLRARLYNQKTSAEVFRSAKRRGFSDLIIVPYVNLENNAEGTSAAKVTKGLIEQWGVTEKKVIDQAIKNTAAESKVEDMMEVMAHMMGLSAEEMNNMYGAPESSQFVISTDNKVNGAAAILAKLDYFKQKFPKGFFVLPSSVHEVLVVPKMDGTTLDAMNKMVREVNATTVAEEEQLADHAYEFEGTLA